MPIFSFLIKTISICLVGFVLISEYAGHFALFQNVAYNPYQWKRCMEISKMEHHRKFRQNQLIRLISGIILLSFSYIYNLFQYPTDIESYFLAMTIWAVLCLFFPTSAENRPFHIDSLTGEMIAVLSLVYSLPVVYLWIHNSRHLFSIDSLLVALTMSAFLFIMDYHFIFLFIAAILKSHQEKHLQKEMTKVSPLLHGRPDLTTIILVKDDFSDTFFSTFAQFLKTKGNTLVIRSPQNGIWGILQTLRQKLRSVSEPSYQYLVVLLSLRDSRETANILSLLKPRAQVILSLNPSQEPQGGELNCYLHDAFTFIQSASPQTTVLLNTEDAHINELICQYPKCKYTPLKAERKDTTELAQRIWELI